MFHLIDKMVEDLFNSLNERFHSYIEDLTGILKAINNKTIDKDQMIIKLTSLQSEIEGIITDVAELRKKVDGVFADV